MASVYPEYVAGGRHGDVVVVGETHAVELKRIEDAFKAESQGILNEILRKRLYSTDELLTRIDQLAAGKGEGDTTMFDRQLTRVAENVNMCARSSKDRQKILSVEADAIRRYDPRVIFVEGADPGYAADSHGGRKIVFLDEGETQYKFLDNSRSTGDIHDPTLNGEQAKRIEKWFEKKVFPDLPKPGEYGMFASGMTDAKAMYGMLTNHRISVPEFVDATVDITPYLEFVENRRQRMLMGM